MNHGKQLFHVPRNLMLDDSLQLTDLIIQYDGILRLSNQNLDIHF